MSKVTISLAVFDELREIKEKFDNLVKDTREKIREEFVDKVTEMAKEIGRKDSIINELQNKNDELDKTISNIRNDLCDIKLNRSSIKVELDILKKRYRELYDRYLRLLNRGLLARIFREWLRTSTRFPTSRGRRTIRKTVDSSLGKVTQTSRKHGLTSRQIR